MSSNGSCETVADRAGPAGCSGTFMDETLPLHCDDIQCVTVCHSYLLMLLPLLRLLTLVPAAFAVLPNHQRRRELPCHA